MKQIPCLDCITRATCVSRCDISGATMVETVNPIIGIEALSFRAFKKMAYINNCIILETYMSGEASLIGEKRKQDAIDRELYKFLLDIFPDYNVCHIKDRIKAIDHLVNRYYFFYSNVFIMDPSMELLRKIDIEEK